MPNTTPSPFMGIPVPTVGVDPGPDWANNLNAGSAIIDAHDHSTGKGAPITGPIQGSAITNATVDNTPIGSITPSTAVFTTASIGPSGFPFKMQRFTGTNTSSGVANLLAGSGYTTFFGAIGLTSYSGGGSNEYALGTGSGTPSSTNVNYLQITSGEIQIQNFDTANSNTFDVTIFYI